MALGAERRQILRLVQNEGLEAGRLWLGHRVCGALALSFVFQSLLYDMSAQDRLTFLAATMISR